MKTTIYFDIHKKINIVCLFFFIKIKTNVIPNRISGSLGKPASLPVVQQKWPSNIQQYISYRNLMSRN